LDLVTSSHCDSNESMLSILNTFILEKRGKKEIEDIE
jgi:hypothetical protein